MSAPEEVPDRFDDARRVITARPIGRQPLALRSMMVGNHGGTDRDVDATLPIAGDLLVGAYLDLPASNVPVSWAMLEEWGVSLEVALRAAQERLANRALRTTNVDGVVYLDSPALAAAVLQDPGIVAQLAPGIAPLVLIPTQQHVIFADARDPALVARAAELAREAVDSGTRPASMSPLVLGTVGWEPAEWPLAAEPAVARLRHYWNNRIYGDARDLVAAANERFGIDAIVAKYQVGAKPSGETMAMTPFVDSPGSRTFLPPADEVLLIAGQGTTTPVPLATLLEIPGLLTPVPNLVPTYLEASRFPAELV